MTRSAFAAAAAPQESGLDQILDVPIDVLSPAPDNDRVYRPVDRTDPEIVALAHSIRKHGIKEPLAISTDRYILSGHRRYAAARLAGLETVPCRVEPISWDDEPDRFLELLTEYNRQREKSLDEKLREEVISCNADDAYEALLTHRKEQSRVDAESFSIVGTQRRAEISAAKLPLLNAIRDIIADREDFWPLSDRQIHYALLNDPPLIHASKPKSLYQNDRKSYRALTDLLTRARVEGLIQMEVIVDETRPVITWRTRRDPQAFLRQELTGMFKEYWRDLMQSQPNHVEIVGEKNTILGIIRPVAAAYRIPLTIMRGFSSLRPRWEIARRFRKSGKQKLVLIVLTDFDPDGQEIAQSVARSIRDDFEVGRIEPIRAAITPEQIEEYDLKASPTKAKTGSANYEKFASEYGDDCYELEALDPEDLQEVLRETINAAIDIPKFNAEADQEKEDAQFLQAAATRARAALRDAVEAGP